MRDSERAGTATRQRPATSIIQPVRSIHHGWIAGKDLLTAAKLFCCLLAATAPAQRWPARAESLARAHLRVQKRSQRLLAHSTAFGDQDSESRARATFAWDYLANIQAIRELLPGGWNARFDIAGRESLDQALGRSRGAVLWFSPFAGAFLAMIKALEPYSLTQLSTPSHPFSPTWFGMRWLNPIRVRVENRYLARRVRVVYGNARPALDVLAQILRDNGVVSIMAIGSGRQSHAYPFLGGVLRLALGAPRLACETGAALVPVFARADDSGGYRVELGPDLMPTGALPLEQALPAITARYVELLQPIVAADPAKWQGWFYPGTWRPSPSEEAA